MRWKPKLCETKHQLRSLSFATALLFTKLDLFYKYTHGVRKTLEEDDDGI